MSVAALFVRKKNHQAARERTPPDFAIWLFNLALSAKGFV